MWHGLRCGVFDIGVCFPFILSCYVQWFTGLLRYSSRSHHPLHLRTCIMGRLVCYVTHVVSSSGIVPFPISGIWKKGSLLNPGGIA